MKDRNLLGLSGLIWERVSGKQGSLTFIGQFFGDFLALVQGKY